MQRHGYHYRKSRKKGLLTATDKKIRMKFARKMLKEVDDDFWKNGISFYFDGVGFAFKTNPLSEARSTKTMAWRKRSEGLELSTKGKKEGTGGKVAQFFVAISHSKGVVLCQQYEERLTGKFFASFIKENFPQAFLKSGKPNSNLFLQDGDKCQNSVIAKEALKSSGYQVFSIPARSPDINPIENVFHNVRNKLKQGALDNEITKETFAQFSSRVSKTIKQFSRETIDDTIITMNKRLRLIIQGKGARTKYSNTKQVSYIAYVLVCEQCTLICCYRKIFFV